jgi:hypothetical protein
MWQIDLKARTLSKKARCIEVLKLPIAHTRQE